ncbi:unnamed protein product [Bursaphelenchus xylophilus]|uniref:(pine wood nematode) hypothetical protein n=1 Tax=Bursaphelenchus xylophilus TaxID=6326 RepID=A0A1I7S505_BURXY|nr:unnamed protein product [Bursaphelenchus xylophilus]CAG9117556.1 unnamed protein product [Bursaphelenchus xylophilus]
MKTFLLFLCSTLAVAITQRKLTDSENQAVLDKFNEVRRRVANGEAKNKAGDSLPTAANIQQINADSSLEDSAFSWVSSCSYGYPNGSNQLNAAISGLSDDYAATISTAIEQWYNVSQSYSGDVSNFQASDASVFTTLIWDTNNITGCAVALCSDLENVGSNYSFVACNFNAGSNFVGKPIYKKGKPCDSCAYGYRCNDSLCYLDPQLPARTPGWLTIGERQTVLDTLNGHRRDLAVGNLTDGNKNKLPTGTDILEIVYDIDLQSIAVNNFTECTSGFGDLDDYNVLSIMMTGVETPDGQEYNRAFSAAINSWWKPTSYTDSISDYQGSDSNFAKLAWAKVSRIGCNREICLFEQQNINVTKVVCVLGEEKGAITGKPVYSSGPTCSSCPSGYACSNSLCALSPSLCSL